VYDNLLWVNIGGWRLIALDIITGELIHQMDPLPVLLGMERKERSHVSISRMHLDKENGLLKIFAHRYYIEFNLNSLKATLKRTSALYGSKVGAYHQVHFINRNLPNYSFVGIISQLQ
jgi:hypothetical protein